MSSALDEYIEPVFEAAFKREFEQDEHIVRSLPFFATAMGLAIGILTQVVPRIPALSSPCRLAVQTLLFCATISIVFILACLFQMVRARQFKLPPNEEAVLEWARDLEGFHKKPYRSAKLAQEKARDEVRQLMIRAYADAATHNRAANQVKFRYRSLGSVALVVLITLASFTVAAIFIDSQIEHSIPTGSPNAEKPQRSADHAPRREHRPVHGENSGQARPGTPQNADRSPRGEVPRSSGGQQLDGGRTLPPSSTGTAAAAADGIRREGRIHSAQSLRVSRARGSQPQT